MSEGMQIQMPTDTLAGSLHSEDARFWEAFNAACVVVLADSVAAAEQRIEDALWDSTLGDGLDDQ